MIDKEGTQQALKWNMNIPKSLTEGTRVFFSAGPKVDSPEMCLGGLGKTQQLQPPQPTTYFVTQLGPIGS